MWSVMVMVLCVPATLAQVYFLGNCPYTPIINNFDWHRYLGRWVEQERYFVSYQTVGRCWTGTYIKDPHTKRISVRLDFRDIILNQPKTLTVDVRQKEPYGKPNFLTYTIPGVPIFEDNYQVLDTDYDNWTLEYACVPKPVGHTRIAWILTRKAHPPKSVIDEAKYALARLKIDVNLLSKQDTSCFKTYHH